MRPRRLAACTAASCAEFLERDGCGDVDVCEQARFSEPLEQVEEDGALLMRLLLVHRAAGDGLGVSQEAQLTKQHANNVSNIRAALAARGLAASGAARSDLGARPISTRSGGSARIRRRPLHQWRYRCVRASGAVTAAAVAGCCVGCGGSCPDESGLDSASGGSPAAAPAASPVQVAPNVWFGQATGRVSSQKPAITLGGNWGMRRAGEKTRSLRRGGDAGRKRLVNCLGTHVKALEQVPFRPTWNL
jgi:hypothetical protein